MCSPYEVITAPTLDEALALSKWTEGDTAEVVELKAAANGDGTWSVFPVFEKKEE